MNITQLGEPRFPSPRNHPVNDEAQIPQHIIQSSYISSSRHTYHPVVILKDIGVFLRQQIEAHFKAQNIPVLLRYFDPSYEIGAPPTPRTRSSATSLHGTPVHAAMAGKTGLVIGDMHGTFIHVPIEMLNREHKRIDPDGIWWQAVLAATGQPPRFE